MPTTQESHVSGVGRGIRVFGASVENSEPILPSCGTISTSPDPWDLSICRGLTGRNPHPRGDQGWPPGGRNSATATPSLRYDLPGTLPP